MGYIAHQFRPLSAFAIPPVHHFLIIHIIKCIIYFLHILFAINAFS